MSNRKNALISLIYPIFDVRGRAADRIRTWTQAQTLERDRYRVVVVSADPSQEREAEVLLGPGDRLVSLQTKYDGALWNAGAACADTPWLVFVEGHSMARPDCLAAVAQWIEQTPSAQIGNFSVEHDDSYLLARLADRWFNAIHKTWHAPGQWHRLHRAGWAVRADLFRTSGGFEPDYGQFAIHVLAARLYDRGARTAFVPSAAVFHQDDLRISGHRIDTVDFVRGELDARERNDIAFCERYFGHRHTWFNRYRRNRQIAVAMAQAVIAAALSDPRHALALLPVFWSMLAGLAGGSMLGRTARRLSIALDEFAIEYLPIPESWRYARFVRSHLRIVRLTEANWIFGHTTPPAPPRTIGHCDIAQLGPDTIIGVHGLEDVKHRLLRWSEPTFLLRIALAPGENSLQIDTGGVRGDPQSYLIAVVIDGRVLPRTHLHSANGRLTIHLPEPWSAAAKSGIVVVSSPLVPAKAGSSDRRMLGMPIYSVQMTSMAAQTQELRVAV